MSQFSITDLVTSYMRKGIIPLFDDSTDTSKNANNQLLAASSAELLSLGFMVDSHDLDGCSVNYLESIVTAARNITTISNAQPMYVNFPDEVKNMSTVELIIDQLVHYISHGQLIPDEDIMVRPELPLNEAVTSAKILDVHRIYDVDVIEYIAMLPVAYDENTKQIFETHVRNAIRNNTESIESLAALTDAMSNRENMQTLFEGALYAADVDENTSVNDVFIAFVPYARHTDTLLRYVLSAYSEYELRYRHYASGHYYDAIHRLVDSYSASLKIRSMSKAARRTLLNKIGIIISNGGVYGADQLVKHTQLWRKVMRMVHPYSLNISPEALYAMDVLHDNVEYRTFNSELERAIKTHKSQTIIDVLRDNRGELVRKLAVIARCDDFTEEKAAEVNDLVYHSRVPVTTLISAYNGIINVNSGGKKLIKNATGNAIVDRDTQSAHHVDIIAKGLLSAVTQRLSECDTPDENTVVGTLSDIPVSLVDRDKSLTDRDIYRGGIVTEFDNEDTLRFFVHWKNVISDIGEYATDVDTALNVYDSDLNHIEAVSYVNYYDSRDWVTFSGDIVNAPGDGAVEYFDVDVTKLRDKHPEARYVAHSAVVYSSYLKESFSDIENKSGVMKRTNVDAGEIYDPRTVNTAAEMNAASTFVVSTVTDLNTNKVYWIDESTGSTQMGHNASTSYNRCAAVIQSALLDKKLTYGELAQLYAASHGLTINDDQAVNITLMNTLL